MLHRRLTVTVFAALLTAGQLYAQVKVPLPSLESQVFGSIVENLDKSTALQLSKTDNHIKTLQNQLKELQNQGISNQETKQLQRQIQKSQKQFGKEIKTIINQNPRLKNIVDAQFLAQRLDNDIIHTISHDEKILKYIQNTIQSDHALALNQNISSIKRLHSNISRHSKTQKKSSSLSQMQKQLTQLRSAQKILIGEILSTRPDLRPYISSRIDRHNKAYHPNRLKRPDTKRRNRSGTARNNKKRDRR